MLAEDPLAVLSGMIEEMMSWRFTPDWNNPQSAMAADAITNRCAKVSPPAVYWTGSLAMGGSHCVLPWRSQFPKQRSSARIRPKSFAGGGD